LKPKAVGSDRPDVEKVLDERHHLARRLLNDAHALLARLGKGELGSKQGGSAHDDAGEWVLQIVRDDRQDVLSIANGSFGVSTHSSGFERPRSAGSQRSGDGGVRGGAQENLRLVCRLDGAHPAERLSVIAFANLDRIRARARALLDTNRQVLNQFLATRTDLEVQPIRFGTTVFPKLLSGPVDAFCELLRDKYDGTVAPGSFFEMPEYFRIGIGGETEHLVESLGRLGAALGEFRALQR